MKEVYDASLILTAEQRSHANYWRGTPDGSAAAYGYSILKKILIEHGNTTMLDKAALAYCKMGIALSDAAISSFKETFRYNQQRPITYIRNVMGHNTWNTLFSTVNNPAYPDFHGTVYSACTAVLTLVFGNNYQFNTNGIHHLGLPGYNFNSFEEAGIHAGISRFYAGVNSMPSINSGLWLGNRTAAYMDSKIKFKK